MVKKNVYVFRLLQISGKEEENKIAAFSTSIYDQIKYK